jgi:hypothetical protein
MSLAQLLDIIHSNQLDAWASRNKTAFESLFGTVDGRYPKQAIKELAKNI